jgi:hypothetical protein
MTKSENILPEINEEDIITIVNLASRIAAKLKKRKEIYNPKEYAKKIQTLLKHKKNIIANFIIYDFNNLDPGTLYSPADFKDKITKNMQSDIHYGNVDVTATIGDEFKSINDYTNSNDISKALKALEKEIGLINIPGKENIKEIKGKQKIEFLGKPSLYKLPPHSESLKRAMSKPKAIELIFKSLIDMGYLPHLTFVCEATFYAIRDPNNEEIMYNLAKMASKQIDKPDEKIDRSRFEELSNTLLFKSDYELKMLAGEVAKYVSEDPDLRQFILFLVLSQSS